MRRLRAVAAGPLLPVHGVFGLLDREAQTPAGLQQAGHVGKHGVQLTDVDKHGDGHVRFMPELGGLQVRCRVGEGLRFMHAGCAGLLGTPAGPAEQGTAARPR